MCNNFHPKIQMNGKILVVDDESDILDAIQFFLEDEGYDVVTNTDGFIMQEITEENLPKLIILDVRLADLDGRELCRNLKRKNFAKDTPVIMISAHVDGKGSIAECGADEFLPKPFSFDALLDLIKRYTASTNQL